MSYRPSDLLRGADIPDAVLQELPKTDLHAALAVTDPTEITAAAAARVEAARLAGVRVLEVRFCPPASLAPEEALAAVQAGLAATDLHTGIVLTGRRDHDPEHNLALSRLAVASRDAGVVAFGMTGPEAGYAIADHREAFYHAKNNNLPSSCDAGETDGPASIHGAIHRCGTIRVGQAVRLGEDPALLDFVNDHRIPLEICLSSNVRSGAVLSAEMHPVRIFHDAGLRVSLCTDDHDDMVGELRLVVDTFDFTLLELEDFLLNGFKSAFVPEQTARYLIEEALADFTRIRDHHGLDALVANGGSA